MFSRAEEQLTQSDGSWCCHSVTDKTGAPGRRAAPGPDVPGSDELRGDGSSPLQDSALGALGSAKRR